MLTHANIAFAALSARAVRAIEPTDVIYGVLPMAHVVGLSSQLIGTMASGASILIEPRFSPALLAKAFESGVTTFTGVPAMYARVLQWLRLEGRAIDAPALRLIGVAGSPLTPTLKEDVERAFGLPLLNGYGLTESSPAVAQVRKEAPRLDCAVGPPIPGVEVRIVSPDGSDAPRGAVGELWVRGPNVVVAYLEVACGKTVDEAALRLFLRDRLSPYKQPTDIHFLAQLPASATGKVLKSVLKTMAEKQTNPTNNQE